MFPIDSPRNMNKEYFGCLVLFIMKTICVRSILLIILNYPAKSPHNSYIFLSYLTYKI